MTIIKQAIYSNIQIYWHQFQLYCQGIKMKTFYSNKLFKISPPIRKRISSVRTTIKREDMGMPQQEFILQKLQKGLSQQLDKQQPILSENSISLPADSESIKIQDKLWKYFVARIDTVKQKVQKQRINFLQRELLSIKQEIMKKRNAIKNHISKLQINLHTKNKQITALFDQFNSEKVIQQNITNLIKAKKRVKQELAQAHPPQNMLKIKSNIQRVRLETSKLEHQLQQYERSLSKIQQQWKSFLKNFLKQGYYFQNGISNILKQMIEMGYTPNYDDFPTFLDEKSKKCLLIQYEQLKQQMKVSNNRSNSFVKSERLTESKKNIRQIIRRQNLMKIYNETKGYMLDWIRNQGWKEESNLPRIPTVKQPLNNEKDWRLQQRKRLLLIDDKQRYSRVKAFLFGSKVQTIQ